MRKAVELVPMLFISPWRAYNRGEAAAFPVDQAERLERNKLAVRRDGASPVVAVPGPAVFAVATPAVHASDAADIARASKDAIESAERFVTGGDEVPSITKRRPGRPPKVR